MKKIILAALLYVSVSSLAQPITDTNQLRSFINSAIVPNNTRAITATIVNRAFNGVLNSYAPIFQRFVDTLYFTGNTMYWRQRGVLYSRPVAGGTSLSYPYQLNRYLNGYGSFVQLNSDSIQEGTSKLFFTNARSRSAITLTNIGTSGAATYNSSTGEFNIPNYASGGVSAVGAFSATGNLKGLSIIGSDLIGHPATSTNPGMISTGIQNIPGVKIFDEPIITDEPNTNSIIPSIYFRDGGSPVSRMGIGRDGGQGSMQFFTYGSYRFYGGGDFNNSATDWMNISSTSMNVNSNLYANGIIVTKNANSNTPTDQIIIRGTVGATSNCGIGKGIADMQFYSNNGYGFRWYGGGQFNNSAANWMKLDEQSLTVGASMRLSGNGGYASINEYTSNSLLIAGSLVGFGSPIQFNGPGYGRGRGEMTANGQVIFSDVNQNNTVRANSTFTVVSNSRGSSPIPVLNQSQRLAMTMSTQDIGLHVYQSDGTEGVWVYKSTGWQFAY